MTLDSLFARTDRYNMILDVTPQLAEDWLTHCNTHNRKLIDAHVDYLAAEMKAGRWRLTHQGIAFSVNRVLLDGQHRLWAIVMSEQTVPLRIFVNEPPEAMDVLDTGKRRSNDQILSLAGDLGQVSTLELATLRATLAGLGRRQRRSPGIEREQLLRHREAIQFALEAMGSTRKYRGLRTASTLSVLARAWYSCDHHALRHFADVLRTGIPKGENDQPILLLFQFLIGRDGQRSTAYDRECYAKAERALASFLKGERPGKLYAAAKELFPLPGEKATAVA